MHTASANSQVESIYKEYNHLNAFFMFFMGQIYLEDNGLPQCVKRTIINMIFVLLGKASMGSIIERDYVLSSVVGYRGTRFVGVLLSLLRRH